MSSFFADDTMLFSIVKNPELSVSDLNHNLGVHTHFNHTKLFFFCINVYLSKKITYIGQLKIITTQYKIKRT